jgi:transposase InsO family protein
MRPLTGPAQRPPLRARTALPSDQETPTDQHEQLNHKLSSRFRNRLRGINAVIESFWGRMQTELLDRRRWKTRVELANAIFEYLEIFHNRRRRHSALGWRTPIEYEKLHTPDVA